MPAHILGFDSRMGGKSRWLSCTFRRGRAIPTKGCSRARSGNWSLGEALGAFSIAPHLPAHMKQDKERVYEHTQF